MSVRDVYTMMADVATLADEQLVSVKLRVLGVRTVHVGDKCNVRQPRVNEQNMQPRTVTSA